MKTLDARAYWMRTLPDFEAMMPFTPLTPEHAAQEGALRDVLHGLEFGSVLDVGCGLGRITSILAGLADDLSAVDIGSDQVAVTQKRVPAASVSQTSIQDFEPDRTWDLVIAVEVLMHIPPAEIATACDRLRALSSRWVVTCDWTEPLPPGEPRDEHNWLHDYDALLSPVRSVPIGRQTIHVAPAESVA